ncbi:MAG: hypothetical protein HYU41_14775 [Candidatus Rokubacteria bacterium]|nr:hypothetical protein [Candidatus Rokubacteria bacterium]
MIVFSLTAGPPTGATQELPFQVEWRYEAESRRGPVVTGYVHNRSVYRVAAVRLRVEVLDSGGRVIDETSGWALGDIAAGAAGFFLVSVPPTTEGAYRLSVTSYDKISREAP